MLHGREHGAGHAKRAGKGDIEHLGPLGVAHLDHALLPTQACVVDQYVNTAQCAFGAGHQRLHLLLAGDITQLAVDRLQTGFGFEPFDGVFQSARMHIRNHQRPTTFFGTAPGGGVADTGTGGGSDQNRLAGQQLMTGNIRGGLFHSVNLQRI
ncbi:hypothetical protein D3C78_724490 [compost metagenome]